MTNDNGTNENAPAEKPEETRGDLADQADAETARKDAAAARKQHEDEMVDEWEDESFPASDPPGHY